MKTWGDRVKMEAHTECSGSTQRGGAGEIRGDL